MMSHSFFRQLYDSSIVLHEVIHKRLGSSKRVITTLEHHHSCVQKLRYDI
jgi:hypothetical protein